MVVVGGTTRKLYCWTPQVGLKSNNEQESEDQRTTTKEDLLWQEVRWGIPQDAILCGTNARAWCVYFDIGKGMKVGSFQEALKKLLQYGGVSFKIGATEIQKATKELKERSHTEPKMPTDPRDMFEMTI